jgi:methylated-DNA-[protein]-cysteine S-methyltransferase
VRRFVDRLATPIGTLALVVGEDDALCAVGFSTEHGRMGKALHDESLAERSNPAGLSDRFRAYFAGDLAAIDSIPVRLAGTDFQCRVWSALREIPCGQTWSYGQLARCIGQPRAVRAVGLANGANPFGLVVPCHRVIGADGSLTGYGAGIERKRWLLEHEGVELAETTTAARRG